MPTIQTRPIANSISLDNSANAAAAPTKQSLASLLVETRFTSSLADARRLIAQGAVRANGEKVIDVFAEVEPAALLQVGKTIQAQAAEVVQIEK